MKRLICIIIFVLMMPFATQAAPFTSMENTRVFPESREEGMLLYEQSVVQTNEARTRYYAILNLGYDREHPIVKMAFNEYVKILKNQKYYLNYCDMMMQTDYEIATIVWLYMKDLGWNDAVCAGIIGNMMTEVGGQTLYLKPYTYGYGGYYGLCQWYGDYCPGVWGADLRGQCDYLRDSIKEEFDVFGFCYASGFDYDDFLQITDPGQAALAFAKCYERCAPGSYNYSVRQRNARVAYDYFVSSRR